MAIPIVPEGMSVDQFAQMLYEQQNPAQAAPTNAYTAQDIARMIDQFRKAGDEASAFALYNQFMDPQTSGGTGWALQTALGNLWGPDAFRQWSVNLSTGGGGGLGQIGGFDPTTGQYTWNNAGTIESGSIAGWDPSRYYQGFKFDSVSPTYDPMSGMQFGTGTGLNAAPGITTNPDGTYAQYNPARATSGAGTSPAAPTPRTGTAPTGGVRPPTNGAGPSLPGAPSGNPLQPPGGGSSGIGTVPGYGGTSTTPIKSHGFENAGVGGATLPNANPSIFEAPNADPYTRLTRPESASAPWDFFNEEGYKFALEEGLSGIENRAAARGSLQSGNTLKELAKYKSGVDAQFYDDAWRRFAEDRGFREGQFRYDSDTGRSDYESDRAYELARALQERGINDENYWKTLGFNEAQRQDIRDFDFMVDKYLRDSDTDLAKWNQMFEYGALTGDRDYQTNTLMDLARLGLGASGSDANLANALANLLSSNNLAGAGAEGAAGVGSASTIAQLVSRILASMQPYGAP
jgi:hypothetical protein